MKGIVVAALACLCLTAAAAWGQDAVELYERGLRSSLAYKKIAYFSKAIQLNPNLADAYEKRATHYYFQEKLDRAIQDYTKVIELKPGSVNAYLLRGLTYLKKGHGEGLVAEVNRLALRYAGLGEPEDSKALKSAIDDFSYVIELDPRVAAAYSYRAEAHRLMGMIDEAIRDSTTAIQLRADQKSTAYAYATRAEIYRQLGQNELYKADLRKSVELDPYSPDYPPLHVPLMLRYSVNTAPLKTVSWLGLLGIIILTFVLIFRVTLRAPEKRDEG
ncbi:MAG: tetratricopeptide repeat protein [Syntrophobacterales bacterium]